MKPSFLLEIQVYGQSNSKAKTVPQQQRRFARKNQRGETMMFKGNTYSTEEVLQMEDNHGI